jgi:hypothetical protein
MGDPEPGSPFVVQRIVLAAEASARLAISA